MFTGLIEKVSAVKTVRPTAGGKVFTIDLGPLAEDAHLGDSIAVNGVCMTITAITGTIADFDVSGETLRKSTLDSLRVSAPVNLERAMAMGQRFGGHIVQGHVDGVATIRTIETKGDFWDITFAADSEILDEIVPKGSVAVNGISLTVARMDANSFSVALIPTTIKDTNLASAKVYDKVNIETDIVTKVVKKQVEKILPDKAGKTLTVDKLRELGF
ncbi:Riboflavin synthase [Anaerohalosphaera lusitana]|uniref:Riboflavin synthase n=1 Tax=Anaerohalosphaera lusitana TaxID=1936003 RepID=A0A1U9NH31_9BACT|nr:riboflavin synthase [Anaerohalosphaera lusitana]AQT67241.1 Riboflavin synthase [Anaerohalosphaera lusitana]